MDISRRQFLRGAPLTREGREQTEKLLIPLGPAPPWHQGIIHADSCRDCHHPCVDACETGVIQLHAADHALKGLPYLAFTQAGCNFCGACVTVCPLPIPKDDQAPPNIGLAQLNQTRCLAWNKVVCMSCRFACDVNAIHMTSIHPPTINEAQCTGCGNCISVCPQQAISL